MVKAAEEGDEDRLGLRSCARSWVMLLETSSISSRTVAEVDLHRAHKEPGLQPPVLPSSFLRRQLFCRAFGHWDGLPEHRRDGPQEEKLKHDPKQKTGGGAQTSREKPGGGECLYYHWLAPEEDEEVYLYDGTGRRTRPTDVDMVCAETILLVRFEAACLQ